MPIHDVALLLTRPAQQSSDFAQSFISRFGVIADVVISPAIRIEPISTLTLTKAESTLIFSSQNAIRAFVEKTDPNGQRACCVGHKTTALANAVGFDAACKGETADQLVATLVSEKIPTNFLHLRGAHARGDIAARLSASGVSCREAVIYDQVAVPLTNEARKLFAGNTKVLLPLFSPRSAEIVGEALREINARIFLAPLSDAVMQACQNINAEQAVIAPQPDQEGMFFALNSLIDAVQRLEG